MIILSWSLVLVVILLLCFYFICFLNWKFGYLVQRSFFFLFLFCLVLFCFVGFLFLFFLGVGGGGVLGRPGYYLWRVFFGGAVGIGGGLYRHGLRPISF